MKENSTDDAGISENKMITESTACFIFCFAILNCARTESHQQERVQKLCSATSIATSTKEIVERSFWNFLWCFLPSTVSKNTIKKDRSPCSQMRYDGPSWKPPALGDWRPPLKILLYYYSLHLCIFTCVISSVHVLFAVGGSKVFEWNAWNWPLQVENHEGMQQCKI